LSYVKCTGRLTTVKGIAAGSTGELIVRLDGGFYNAKVIATCQRADVRFSVTCRNDSKIRAAVAAIKDTAWTAIPYWSSHVDPDTGEIVESHADVAEIGYTAFAGSTHPVTARLIVRRVRRLRPRQGQLELDTDLWDRLRRPSPGRRAEISGAVAGGVHVARRGVHRLAAALMPGAPTCPATANVVAVVECSGGGGGAGALVGGSGRAPRPLSGGGASRRP